MSSTQVRPRTVWTPGSSEPSRARKWTPRILVGAALCLGGSAAFGAFAQPASGAQEQETAGVFRDGEWHLSHGHSGGMADQTFAYGQAGDQPIVGDWNGDGQATVGVRRGSRVFLRNDNSSGNADITFHYGREGDQVLVGDWNGDGTDTIGVRRGDLIHLRNSNGGGPADLTFHYGRTGDVTLTGDWNGDGVDTIAIRRGNVFHLRNNNTGGPADLTFHYGWSTDLPVSGDWNGDGVTTVGVARDGRMLLRNTNRGGAADIDYWFGGSGDQPVAGSWQTVTTAASGYPDVPGAPAMDDPVWVRLADCESNNNWQAISGNGLYYGGLQFLPETWWSVGGEGMPHEATREEQIYRAQILQVRSGWGQWPACADRLGLR